MLSTSRDPTSRLRAGLNPLLTTSLGVYQNQQPAGTPLSAISMTSAHASGGFSTVAQTPVSAIQPYNPQEWIASPMMPGSDRSSQRYSSLSSGEPQGSPLPPPPYSPPRSQQPRPQSQMFGSSPPPANMSVARAPAPSMPHHSPDQPPLSGHAFAPPPPGGGRGPSRERRFGLPSFRRRDRDSAEATTPPDTSAPIPPMYPSAIVTDPRRRQHMNQLSLHIPPPQQQQQQNEGGLDQALSTISGSAPGSRRAQSASAVETPVSARSRSASQVRWENGAPMPPPPPGPPPGSRSQSMSRTSSGSDPVISPPTRRPPPSGVTALGPVPPTPANWSENGQPSHYSQTRSRSPPEIENQSSVAESSSIVSSASGMDSTAPLLQQHQQPDSGAPSSCSSAGLARTGAVRGEKTLRERRTESRCRGVSDSIDASVDAHSGMADIVIPGPSQLSRRMTIGRGTPRSATRPGGDTPQNNDDTSRNSTPRAPGSAQLHNQQHSEMEQQHQRHYPGAQTPPFSPRPQKPYHLSDGPNTAPPLAPKALPTPPPQHRSASSSRVRTLTLENITPATSQAPLSPTRLVTRETAVRQTADQFCRGTIERFKAFAHKEAAAANDAERVRLFADFIVAESRVRRERYASSIGAMGSEVLDLTRDLFRPMPAPQASTPGTRRESVTSQVSMAEFTPQSSEPSRSHRGSMGSVSREPFTPQQSAGLVAEGQSNSAPPSAGLPLGSPTVGPSNPGNWQQPATANYMPSLSPILSMSISDAYDEDDSRGRPASRWWEAESNGAPSMRIERSRRESKYMGVGTKEAREALQWADDEPLPRDSLASTASVATPSSQQQQRDSSAPGPSSASTPAPATSSGEYPPEKTGWHDTGDTAEAHTPQPHLRHSMLSAASLSASSAGPSTPLTAATPSLDVSRLVTLPPPYPRHHPAVNNSHPDLVSMRTSVRALSDLADTEALKSRSATEAKSRRDEAAASSRRRVASLRSNLQAEIARGNMAYAEAAAIEADSAEAEKAALRDLEKADFEHFQKAVVAPVNEALTSRITNATAIFEELRAGLFADNEEPSPNMPQEEGDERPELLEKLTLLKWIFEAREALHRAIFDLLTERNDRYRDVVLTPYKLSGNQAKLDNAKAFFAEDAAKRAAAFAAETLQRTREFRDVVEHNVSRGVEVQLSAFWDIAPPLKQLLDEIPADLRGFRIRVPQSEMVETPSYGEHPLQYLFSLLLHTEKSTYQFIESQTNLLCLLHEVKEAVANARARANAEAAAMDGKEGGGEEVQRMRVEEGRQLTADLKEKVRVVQDQWNSALGDCVGGVKERVGEWLLQTGGWDESLEEGAVGM